MRKHLLVYSVVAGLCLLTKSCIKEGDLDFRNLGLAGNIVYDLPIPLVDAHLTLPDLLKNFQGQRVVPGPDGLMRIIYEIPFAIDFSDLDVDLPNQEFRMAPPTPVRIPPGSEFPADTILFSNIFWTTFFNDPTKPYIRLDTLQLRKLNFQFQISTEIRNRVRVELRSYNIQDPSGNPFFVSATLPGRPVPPQTTTVYLDLSNYRIVLDNSFDHSPQQIRFEYRAIVFRDNAIIDPYYASTNLVASFQNFDADLIYGFFGQETVGPLTGGIDLPIMDRFPMELLEVKNADMKLTITNSKVGIPVFVDAEISTLTHDPANPKRTLEISENIEHPISLLAPPTVSTFRKEIQDLINTNAGGLPYRMEYSVGLTTNPDNNRSIMNFIARNSLIRMAASVEIPMQLRVGGLTVLDTINFPGLPSADGVELFVIKANIHNAFPLDAMVFLYFLNENNQIIDSLRISDIKGAPVDPINGHVLRPSVGQIDITLNEIQIRHLVNTRHFKIKGILNTTDVDQGTFVSIFENSASEGFLKVMIGCRIKASAKLVTSFTDRLRESNQK